MTRRTTAAALAAAAALAGLACSDIGSPQRAGDL